MKLKTLRMWSRGLLGVFVVGIDLLALVLAIGWMSGMHEEKVQPVSGGRLYC